MARVESSEGSAAVARVTVRLPPALRELVACERSVEVSGHTVGDALRDLVEQQPALALHLFDETGALRRLVLCFCNHEDLRGAGGLERVLEPGDTITLVNSVAGG